MKRRPLYTCIAVLLCIVAVIGAAAFLNLNSKFAAIRYVRNSQTDLMEFAGQIIEDGSTTPTTCNGWDVSYYNADNMVQFMVSTCGAPPNDVYKGFYYSPEDKPLGFQGTEMEFTPEGNGWTWDESSGDNSEYTEKIVDNWYWFEMKF